MPLFVRTALSAAIAAVVAATAIAQDTKAGRPPQPPTTGASGKTAADEQVLATVNGEPIHRWEVLAAIKDYEIPRGQEQDAYDLTMDMLVREKLVEQFVRAQKIPVPAAEVDAEIAKQETLLKKSNIDLKTYLQATGITMDQLKQRTAKIIQWKKYLMAKATEAELKRYVEANKDLFNGTLVRASHILMALEPTATASKKEQAKQKLAQIKAEIESGKISFADAANKYSEDPGNKAPQNGGDLDYFPRRGKYIETFTEAAFKLKTGEVSDPVETEYGYHLIQVTDRKPGAPIDFAQNKDEILNQYAVDEMTRIAEAQHAKAKIDIKPMPADLIPSEPVSPPPLTAPTPGQTPKDAGKGASPRDASKPKATGKAASKPAGKAAPKP